jgi:hypothetical protein
LTKNEDDKKQLRRGVNEMCFVLSYDESTFPTPTAKFIAYTLVGNERFEKFCYVFKTTDADLDAEDLDLFLGIFFKKRSNNIVHELKKRITESRLYKTKYVISTGITSPVHHSYFDKKKVLSRRVRRVFTHLSLNNKMLGVIDEMIDVFLYELEIRGKNETFECIRKLDNIEISFTKTTKYISMFVHVYGYSKLGELIDKTERLVREGTISVHIGPEWNKLIKQPMNFVYCEEIN